MRAGKSRQRAAWGMLGALCIASCAQKPAPVVADVPVTVATATRGDVPVALTGLGQVTAFYTASARAQTTGIIVSLAFAEGQTVRVGQPLAQIDPRPLQAALAQSEAALVRDLAALAGAEDVLRRTAPLVSQGLASPQQVVALRSTVDQLVGTVAADRAQITSNRLLLAYATIRAPIAGVTGVRMVDPGNLVSPTDTTGIVTITQIQPITMLFTLSQTMLPDVQAAVARSGSAPLQVQALVPGTQTVLDTGRLSVINNQIDSGTGTVQLKAVFPNAAKRLWPGQQVTARLILNRTDSAITVPASAIQRNATGTFLWVIDPDRKARIQAVSVGRSTGTRTVVSSGLKGGEQVVTDGQFALAPGRVVAASRAASADNPVKSDDPARLGLSL